MAVERKYERDVDILLAEEFSVSSAFADWFRSRTRFHESTARVADVFVSKYDDTGESDLLVLFEDECARRFSIHIEDKIDACFQPNQVERYHARAKADIAKGLYADYAVVLCAPRNYCDGVASDAKFDAIVSYEDMSAALLTIGDCARSRYRAEFLSTAAQRATNAWTRVEDAATKIFWDAAHELAATRYPILEMRPYDVTKNETWRVLRPADFPTKPKLVQVHLKGMHGNVDLSFAKTDFPAFASRIGPLLEEGMIPVKAGASSAIRLKAPPFTIADGVEVGLPKVQAAFDAAERLINFYRRRRDALDAIVGSE